MVQQRPGRTAASPPRCRSARRSEQRAPPASRRREIPEVVAP
uniref:Uncharacterized protein n=1 Tax=Arundo donax TaxID=35708 RepID=A0A0A9GJU5_ARUDO